VTRHGKTTLEVVHIAAIPAIHSMSCVIVVRYGQSYRARRGGRLGVCSLESVVSVVMSLAAGRRADPRRALLPGRR